MRRRDQAMRSATLLGAALLMFMHGSATAQGFHDDFDGSVLDATIWVVEAGDGVIVVADGVAALSCSGTSFPVAITREDPFPAGDFSVRVGLRYLAVAGCGDGFGAVDGFWPGQGCSPFKLWQDAGGWYVYAGSLDYTLLGPAPQFAYHIYEWQYVGGEYYFSLDSAPLTSGGCAPRPTAFFFGHPHPISCGGGWTSFEIDFVHIEPFAPVQVRASTWGRLKRTYR